MNIKLIALDLDGTTLNSRGQLTEETRDTLEEVSQRGIHVVIATGRVFSALPEEVVGVRGIEYAITSNGARVVHLESKNTIYTNLIRPDSIVFTADLLERYDFMLEAFVKGEAFIDSKIYHHIEKVGLAKKHSDYILRTRKPVEGILDFIRRNPSEVENININFGRQEDKAMMAEVLKSIPEVTITSSFDHNLEIGGRTTSKADAVFHLCGILDIQREHTMAFGDSPNDEAMLRASGYPVAMANGKESIRSIARFITDSNDENGVAAAIRKLIINSPQ
jgi:Cof subfamily protein (haloacid dehalogenase superfamily)